MRSFGASLRGFGLTQPDLQVEASVTIVDHVELTGQGELFRCVLTDGLEQLVQAGVGVSQEQRLLDQAGGQVRDLRCGIAIGRADRVDLAGEVEATGEHRHPPQQETLVLHEQGVAPLHRGSQRPRRTVGADRLREEIEQVVEVPRDVLQVESDHPRRGELDREWKPVDAAADLPTSSPARSPSSEAWARAPARSWNRRTASASGSGASR